MKILLEIGVEEIPASFIKPALDTLKKNLSTKLKENRVSFEEIKTFGTPRRLVLECNGVANTQEDLDTLNTGPAKSVAYDTNGELTRAGMGFAKSQGVEVVDLEIVETEKGEYISVRKFEKGKETKGFIGEILKELIETLTFPKSMKWALKKMKFARPIKWILALCDDEKVEFEIEGIKTSNESRGHRFFGENFEVSSVEEYFEKVRENNVIIDIEERKELIREGILREFQGKSEKVILDEKLLDEVTNLVEYPYPVVGSFNPEFLEVPQEVLIISMMTHQRYFPVVDSEGVLLPKFVTIRNGIEGSSYVRNGNEKVLSARLSDARFFYKEDLKKPLINNLEKLKDVVFQKDLGTIYDKITRCEGLVSHLVTDLTIEEKKADIVKCLHLAKCDLVSNMIGEKEFTKLQGFMGRKYALKNGEKESIALGIEEHYYPRYQGDKLPQGVEGKIVGICDRIDTLVGCFSVGIIPSGSKDPFALRRATLGIINIFIDSKLDISLFDLVERSLDIYATKGILKRSREEVLEELKLFIKQRVINVLEGMSFERDLVHAVIDHNYENLMEAIEKIGVLEKVSKKDEFKEIVNLLKRVENISKNHKEFEVNESLLIEDSEKALYEFYKEFDLKSELHLETKSYEDFFIEISNGREVINDFFDNTMVMVDDEEIKNNRLSLLKGINNKFNSVANLSLIEEK